jgi:prepilin-type processing-associated H-X9-DG protein
MVSYNTALGFLVTHNTTSTNARSDGVGLTIAWTHWNPPPGYSVRITAIGDATRKIYIADGARYTKNDVGPDADLSYDGYMGGGFADQGASTRFTAAWHRGLAAGNGSSGNDARLCWARHGERSPGAPGGYFRFNAGFFDGHVESLDDLEAANPALWYPKGTRFNATLSQMFPDAFGRYFGGQSQTWTVP